MKVKAIVEFEYPRSLSIRNRIRRGDHMPFEERGEIVQVPIGATIDAPADLLDSWLASGYVEAIAEPEGGESHGD